MASDALDPVLRQQDVWNWEYRKKGKLWGKVPLEPTAYSENGVFLDLGCGNGKNLQRKKFQYSHRIGVDFSYQALSLLRKNTELDDVACVCADVTLLPIHSDSVHCADAHHVIGHLLAHDRTCAANEISRVLAPNASLLVTVFGTGDFRSGRGKEIEHGTYLRGNGIFTHYFSPEELKSLFPAMALVTKEKISWFMKIKGCSYLREIWVIWFTKI
ncbi:MAG: class I SAM-dependent methyltransferase [Methanomicrobiales archaeon]|nr:class I SAM-dependent methyltransferase [Methanomicrobiales archaeon]